MRRCILHIGSPKTGTTSIQSVLRKNQSLFLERGILVPTEGQSGKGVHPSLAHKLAGLPVRPEWERADESFIRELEETNPHTVIISVEYLWKLTAEKAMSEQLVGRLKSLGFDIEYLCYVRNQPQFLNSAYTQGIKSFQHGLRFDRYVRKHLTRTARLVYTKRIEIAQELGVRFTARPFSAEVRKQGLIKDFLATIGISSPDAFVQEAQLNQSVSPLHVATARRLYRRLVGKRKLTKLQARAFARSLREEIEACDVKEPAYVGLRTDLSREIQDACREDNDRFAQFAWGKTWAEVFPTDVAQTFESNDYELSSATDAQRALVREIADRLTPKLEKVLNDEKVADPVAWNSEGNHKANGIANLWSRLAAS